MCAILQLGFKFCPLKYELLTHSFTKLEYFINLGVLKVKIKTGGLHMFAMQIGSKFHVIVKCLNCE
jgi:hypothetical protein